MKGREIKCCRIYKLVSGKRLYYHISRECEKGYYFHKDESGAYEYDPDNAKAEIDKLALLGEHDLQIEERILLWPTPQVSEDYSNGVRCWIEICKEAYNHFLECMPPIYHGQGYGYEIDNIFLNSEEYTHNKDTQEPVYLACLEYDARYYSMLMTVKEWKSRQFGINLKHWGIDDEIPHEV